MSVCTFIRKQLKTKGKTEHTGRGCYWMRRDCSWDELKERVEKKLVEWNEKGIVESSEMTEEKIQVVFTKEFHNGYYRCFYANRQWDNMMGVSMVCDF